MTDDTPSAADRRAYLEQKIAWNERNLESLARDKRRIPFLFGLLLLSIPAGVKFGFVGAVIVVVGTLVTVATGYYLIWGHHSEYQQKIDELKEEMEKLEAQRREEMMRRLSQSP